MKLENQVVTLEQGKRLFELGLQLNSQLSWCWNGAKLTPKGNKDFFLNRIGHLATEWTEAYPAYSVAELGAMLPDGNQLKRAPNVAQFKSFRIVPKWQKDGEKYLCSADLHNIHHVTQDGIDAHAVWKIKYGATEAQARAAMLIYLLENGLLTSEQANDNLKNS